MPSLTLEQAEFLNQQNIPLSRVFDATAMSKSDYKMTMSALGMIIAFGVSACGKAGHTLRTRSGHCAQCNTAALAFLMRYDDPGKVYVAYSKAIGSTKIGVAGDHIGRLRSLNDQGYGGASDWIVRFYSAYDKAGRIECIAQQRLGKYRVPTYYYRSGKPIECQELFKCKPELAIRAVKSAAEDVR